MRAGKEIDELTHTVVMRNSIQSYHAVGSSGSFAFEKLPPYSSDIAAAWKIVEKYETRFSLRYDHISDMWAADFGEGEAQAETAPHAICLASLLMVSL